MKIGGEFEYKEYEKLPESSLYEYLLKRFLYIYFFFSGRSALYSLVKNIVNKTEGISAVYLPAYLCESIYLPIKEAIGKSAIKMTFYTQNEKFCSNIENIMTDNSIVYILDYFGKIDKPFLNKLRKFKEQHSNVILIRDITHSLFNEEYSLDVDYYICSLRKWIFLPDGAFIASNSREIKKPLKIADNKYIQARIVASMLKRLNAISNSNVFKDRYYLSIFQFCEEKLNEYFKDVEISKFSLGLLHKIDYKCLIKRRNKNKEYLLGKISKFREFSVINGDFSFFVVPILFKQGKDRNSLRKKLADLDIFLPIHWPIEWQKNINKDIYYHNRNVSDRILSFVIDQRYEEREMEYQVNAIKKVVGK